MTLLGSPREIAQNIQTTIMNQTGIYARVGIGPNKVLAKMACDHFAKNTSGIYELRADRVAADLWPLPIENYLVSANGWSTT